jgi:hypothetical protein
MLRAFLKHPDRLKPGTPAQFLALAPQIDAELRKASTARDDPCHHTPHCQNRAACQSKRTLERAASKAQTPEVGPARLPSRDMRQLASGEDE